jgi:hypothetical protein
MRWLHGRSSGVFGAGGNASVTAVLDTMAVTVSDGNGWLSNENADGIVWWINNEAESGEKLKLSLDMADAVLPRIDRVVISWETTNYVALPEVIIVKGAPASNPTAPALTNNSTARQISLAAIRIPAGATAITAAMITDERLDKSVCGLVTAGIGVDTTVMHNQFDAFLKSIQSELAELEAGTAVEMKKRLFTDTVVPASAFSETGEYDAYPYRASVALEGVLASMIPEIIYGMEDATSGNFAPVAETYNGGVYLFATDIPEGDTEIPTIICWRG